MTVDELRVGQTVALCVHDEKNSIEREVTIFEKSLKNPLELTLTSIHEDNEEGVKSLVVLDYGVMSLGISADGRRYMVDINKVLHIRKGKHIYYKVTLASMEMLSFNRRAYKRFPITADVEIMVNGDEKHIYTGFMKDVCFGGLCFSLYDDTNSLGIGDSLLITIKYKEYSVPLKVAGILNNSREEETTEGRRHIFYGVALAAEYEQIRNLVARIERKGLYTLKHEA